VRDEVFALLIKEALGATLPSDLTRVLKVLANACGACASVLWECAPDSPRSDDGRPLPEGKLFVAAQWSAEPRFLHLHDLEVGSTKTGEAILANRPCFVRDIDKEESGIRGREFLRTFGIRSFMSIPLAIGLQGALTLYWKTAPPEETLTLFEEVSLVVPLAYHAINNRAATTLLRSIDEVLDQTDKVSDPPDEVIRAAVREVCICIAKAFQCLECSLVLEDASEGEGPRGDVSATTWPESPLRDPALGDPGGTIARWVRANKTIHRAFDLSAFGEDNALVLGDASFSRGAELARAIKERSDDARLAGGSFSVGILVAPLSSGGYPVGVLTCLAPSTHFSTLHAATIEAVTALVARWWTVCRDRRRVRRENDLWRALAAHIKSLGSFAQRELSKEIPSEAAIRTEADRTKGAAGAPESRNDPRSIAADLVDDQLGLYVRLLAIQREKREAVRTEERAWGDLVHQLRSPILWAYTWAQKNNSPPVLRGMLGKARRVAINTGFFRDLPASRAVQVKLKPLRVDLIVQRLIEAAADAQSLIPESSRIEIHVDRRTFDQSEMNGVRVDYDLIGQAVSNLLDNARKYSYPDTKIHVSGGITGSNRFHISVSNRGLTIKASEIASVAERGYRGNEAQMTTGEGAGIGLWIVDQIMDAHLGHLVVVPTDSRGDTIIKLVFPRDP
jgi:signal transduction histidine kinase